MHRLTILVITFLLISNYSYSKKDTLDFKTVDFKTYGYYMNQNWDSLIFLGNKALDNNIDYYYLRIRIGVAYFEKHKYQKAIIHFEHALKFNSQSEFAMEYLYYSYIYSGRETEASLLSKSFSDSLKSKTKLSKFKIVSGVYADGGYIISNNEKKNQNIDFDGSENLFGEADLAKDKYYFHLGLQHNFGKKLSIYHSYNYLSINNTKIVKTYNIIRVTDNYITYQHEYYINANWFMKRGFIIIPAFHYSYLKFKLGIINKDTVLKNYIGSLALSKYFSNSNVSLFLTYSDFDTSRQIQAGLLLTVYPFNNLKLYSTTGLINKNDFSPPPPQESGHKGPNTNITSGFVFYELLGFNYYKNNWLEISATYGNLKNYNEQNAMIIYNTPDKINYKLEANLLFQLNNKIMLSFGYQYWDFTGSYLMQKSTVPKDIQTINTNYQNHLITGGIKWNL